MEVQMSVERFTNPPPPSLKTSDTLKAPETDEPEKKLIESVKEEAENEKTALETPQNADINNETTANILGQTIHFEVTETVNVDSGATEKNLVVSVVDEETGKVIRKIPPDEVRQIRNFSKLVGIMLDQDY